MKVLMYSGGMDSWLIDKLWKPDVRVYVDMKTAYSQEERRRLPGGVIVEELPLGCWERSDGIIPLRNLFLVAIGSYFGDTVLLGATAGDRVLDKSETFAEKASDLLSFLYQPQHWTVGRLIEVSVAYKYWRKSRLLRAYLEEGGDLQQAFSETFSCYHPENGQECWSCKACYRKWVAFAVNGYIHECNAPAYIEEHILPAIKCGQSNRGQEDDETLWAVEEYHRRRNRRSDSGSVEAFRRVLDRLGPLNNNPPSGS